jgi:outer membrane scaffolding protein for murein synthesis (MipA/OmpV family)
MVLAPLGGPVPDWRVSLGGGAAAEPVYEGSDHYNLMPAPVIDIRYRDIAFLSDGDGAGVNLIRGDTYRAGIALSYDIGRDQHLARRLNGLRDIDPSPEPRLFAEVALLPVVLTFDLRHAIGGPEGLIGDIGAYIPVIGRENLVVFVGPSVTFASQRYMQSYFGISTAQSMASYAHFATYTAHGGLKDATLGVTAIYHFTENWFTDASLTWERLADSAGNSPIVQDRDQVGVSLTVGYQF